MGWTALSLASLLRDIQIGVEKSPSADDLVKSLFCCGEWKVESTGGSDDNRHGIH